MPSPTVYSSPIPSTSTDCERRAGSSRTRLLSRRASRSPARSKVFCQTRQSESLLRLLCYDPETESSPITLFFSLVSIGSSLRFISAVSICSAQSCPFLSFQSRRKFGIYRTNPLLVETSLKSGLTSSHNFCRDRRLAWEHLVPMLHCPRSSSPSESTPAPTPEPLPPTGGIGYWCSAQISTPDSKIETPRSENSESKFIRGGNQGRSVPIWNRLA